MCMMWRMLCCYVAKFILLRFTLFIREICFVAIYAILHGEKVNKKLCLWRKNDKYQVCPPPPLSWEIWAETCVKTWSESLSLEERDREEERVRENGGFPFQSVKLQI